MSNKEKKKKLDAEVNGVPVDAHEIGNGEEKDNTENEPKKEEKKMNWKTIGSKLLKAGKILAAVALAVGGGAAAGATALKIADNKSKAPELPKSDLTGGSIGSTYKSETNVAGDDTISQF